MAPIETNSANQFKGLKALQLILVERITAPIWRMHIAANASELPEHLTDLRQLNKNNTKHFPRIEIIKLISCGKNAA